MNTLTFNQTSIQPVPRPDNQIWITASDLANALGYARADAVSRIFDRNQDEFDGCMSLTVNLTVNGINNSLRHKSVRIFSLRGCHLVAMFAKTELAKQFRRWVLDLLAQQGKPKPDLPQVQQTMPTRDQLMIMLNFLGKRKQEIEGWGEANLQEYFLKHFHQLPMSANFQTLLLMISRLESDTEFFYVPRGSILGEGYKETEDKTNTNADVSTPNFPMLATNEGDLEMLQDDWRNIMDVWSGLIDYNSRQGDEYIVPHSQAALASAHMLSFAAKVFGNK